MYEELLKKAKQVSYYSHSPYNKFCVGAALLTRSGKIYTGCNIDNYGLLSICGERVAFTKAFSEGEPTKDKDNYVAIMVVGRKEGSDNFEAAIPCGYCRQFMSEFVKKDFKVLTYEEGRIVEYTLEDLLPNSFDL